MASDTEIDALQALLGAPIACHENWPTLAVSEEHSRRMAWEEDDAWAGEPLMSSGRLSNLTGAHVSARRKT